MYFLSNKGKVYLMANICSRFAMDLLFEVNLEERESENAA